MTKEALSLDSVNQSNGASNSDAAATNESNSENRERGPLPDEDGLNSDGRKIGDWESRYPARACAEIRKDAWFVGLVLGLTLLLLILVWNGALYAWMAWRCGTRCSALTLNKYALFFLGGLLGGIIFGIKYLYKVVGRGLWNMDRRLWRIFSPFVSGGLALVVGAMVDSGIMGLTITTSTASGFLSMGFITGYFADGALAKMQDVADTIFGTHRGNVSSSSTSEK